MPVSNTLRTQPKQVLWTSYFQRIVHVIDSDVRRDGRLARLAAHLWRHSNQPGPALGSQHLQTCRGIAAVSDNDVARSGSGGAVAGVPRGGESAGRIRTLTRGERWVEFFSARSSALGAEVFGR